jgi:hypothetical protein
VATHTLVQVEVLAVSEQALEHRVEAEALKALYLLR